MKSFKVNVKLQVKSLAKKVGKVFNLRLPSAPSTLKTIITATIERRATKIE